MKACIVVTTNLCYTSLFFLTLHVLVLCPDSLFLLNSSWQMCDTWCNIAYVHEKAGHEYDEIKDAYSRALEYAEQSGKLSSVVGFVEQYIKLWNIPHTPPLIQHFVLFKVVEHSFGSLWLYVICQIMARERFLVTSWNVASEKCTDKRFWLTGKSWHFRSFHGNMNDWIQP